MGKKYFGFLSIKKTFIILTGLIFFCVLFDCCRSTRPDFRVSQFMFTYEGEKYRVRSIQSADQNMSYNELIGKTFVAADFDQDRILDQVTIGETDLSAAQIIYEYSLNMLTKENKLQETKPDVDQYYQRNTFYDYEIKSFRPMNADPFNEFKIIDKNLQPPHVSIYIDLKADGTLDDTLKGVNAVEEIQPKYLNVLETGLQKGKLIKIDNQILVKEE